MQTVPGSGYVRGMKPVYAICLLLSALAVAVEGAREVPISKLPNAAELMCETCQALVYWEWTTLQNDVLPSRSTWKGGMEVAIEQMFENQANSQDGPCPYKVFSSFAKTATPAHDTMHMMRVCNYILSQSLDDLSELLAAGLSEDVIRAKFCVPTFKCTSKMLWKEEQYPANRPGTAAYNTRIGEEYMRKVREGKSADELERGYSETESGILYKRIVTVPHETPKPELTDRVRVRYIGWFVNGTQFDSSDREFEGTGAEFPVRGVIQAWTQTLQDMKVGERRRIVVPPHLGYGETGVGSIGPNSTLIFDMQLLQIIGKSDFVEPAAETPKFESSLSPPSVHEEL